MSSHFQNKFDRKTEDFSREEKKQGEKKTLYHCIDAQVLLG